MFTKAVDNYVENFAAHPEKRVASTPLSQLPKKDAKFNRNKFKDLSNSPDTAVAAAQRLAKTPKFVHKSSDACKKSLP